MWMRGLDGRVVNLAHASDISIQSPDDRGTADPHRWTILARLGPQHRVALAAVETRERAQAILDTIWQAVKQSPDGFLEF